MKALVLLALLAAPPTLSTGDYSIEVNQLVELRAEPNPPEGFTVLDQEWSVLDLRLDWRQYDNGSVFVATGPPGSYQVRWRGQYLRITPEIEGRKEWRVYSITIRGPPVVVPPVVTPTDPPPVVPPVTPTDPTDPGPARRVTYVYEIEKGNPPRAVQAVLRKLSQAGIETYAIDQNVPVPARHQTALSAISSVPSLVIEDGKGGVKVIANPTEQDVLRLLP